ncbi:GPP34 family phosphoprotein [Streptomyces sp. NPDC085612]|uniref:GPP34 family phosphoprotein n=1 Tax=Streptomyces sp. NPDC085612 TaxID=3365732 RepID=UPI0037CD055A
MTTPARLYTLCAADREIFPPPRRATEAGRGLAGALLLQAALAGRLDLSGGRVRPTGRGSRGDPVLDAFVGRIEASARDRPPRDWVERLGPYALAALRAGALPGAGRPSSAQAAPDPAGARERVRRAVDRPDPSGLSAVAAGALLAASGLHRGCWPHLSRGEAHKRTLRAVAALGSAGLPAVRAATAVHRSLSGSAGALAFPG